MSRIEYKGLSARETLAQTDMFGGNLTQEGRELLSFISDNIRSPRRIADFIQAYLDALEAYGNPAQGSLLGGTVAPSKADLIAAARRKIDAELAVKEAISRKSEGADARNVPPAGEGQQRPEDTRGGPRGAQQDEAERRRTAEEVNAAERQPQQRVAENVADPIGWDAMGAAEREELVRRAGWVTRKGGLTVLGKRISGGKWAELSPAARNALMHHVSQEETKNAQTVRGDQRQPNQTRGTRKGGQDAGREDLQREPKLSNKHKVSAAQIARRGIRV